MRPLPTRLTQKSSARRTSSSSNRCSAGRRTTVPRRAPFHTVCVCVCTLPGLSEHYLNPRTKHLHQDAATSEEEWGTKRTPSLSNRLSFLIMCGETRRPDSTLDLNCHPLNRKSRIPPSSAFLLHGLVKDPSWTAGIICFCCLGLFLFFPTVLTETLWSPMCVFILNLCKVRQTHAGVCPHKSLSSFLSCFIRRSASLCFYAIVYQPPPRRPTLSFADHVTVEPAASSTLDG